MIDYNFHFIGMTMVQGIFIKTLNLDAYADLETVLE